MNSFTYSFIEQIFIVCILFTRHWVGNRAWSSYVLILGIRYHRAKDNDTKFQNSFTKWFFKAPFLEDTPCSLKGYVAKLIWLTLHCIYYSLVRGKFSAC